MRSNSWRLKRLTEVRLLETCWLMILLMLLSIIHIRRLHVLIMLLLWILYRMSRRHVRLLLSHLWIKVWSHWIRILAIWHVVLLSTKIRLRRITLLKWWRLHWHLIDLLLGCWFVRFEALSIRIKSFWLRGSLLLIQILRLDNLSWLIRLRSLMSLRIILFIARQKFSSSKL